MPADQSLISHVSDTARWVAYYRAIESDRPDALFRDRFARRLAGEQGKAIAHGIKRGLTMAWPMIVRTAVLDEMILEAVRARGVDVVLNLAAGLDTRPWRLPLPPSLHWVDVDLAPMLDLKLGEIGTEAPVCGYEAVRLDLADLDERRRLFRRVGDRGKRVLVMTEGLLIYLTADLVAGLARDLHQEPAFAFWLTDLASPDLIRMLEKTWGKTVRAGNAPFQFAPAEGTAFFRPLGWREAEWRSTFHEGLRLKRTMRFGRFWGLLMGLGGAERREKAKRFSGIALLERG